MKIFKLKTGDVNCLSLFLSKQEAVQMISNLSEQLAADAHVAVQPIEFPINLGKSTGLFMTYVLEQDLEKKNQLNSNAPIDLVDTLPPKAES